MNVIGSGTPKASGPCFHSQRSHMKKASESSNSKNTFSTGLSASKTGSMSMVGNNNH